MIKTRTDAWHYRCCFDEIDDATFDYYRDLGAIPCDMVRECLECAYFKKC